MTENDPSSSGQATVYVDPKGAAAVAAWATKVPARAPLEELGAARLAVDAADALAVAQRVGDAQDVAEALAAYEQASLAYHTIAGQRPAAEADGGAGS